MNTDKMRKLQKQTFLEVISGVPDKALLHQLAHLLEQFMFIRMKEPGHSSLLLCSNLSSA
jgi:hypothetical protein